MPTELENIKQVLDTAVNNGLCQIVYRESSNKKSLLTLFGEYGQNMYIFHFAGLSLQSYIEPIGKENEEIVTNMENSGISKWFINLKKLKLVFLNIYNNELADELIKIGIPVVIAGSNPLSDKVAADFATQFYYSLAKNNTIEFAFNYAARYLVMTGEYEEDETTHKKVPKKTKRLIPYKLFYKDEAAKNWRLGDLAIENQTF